jgi:hypothetical protein
MNSKILFRTDPGLKGGQSEGFELCLTEGRSLEIQVCTGKDNRVLRFPSFVLEWTIY